MSECTRCGECCKAEVCDIGWSAFNSHETPCAGLVKRDGQYACSLVLAEAEFGLEPFIANTLGIGVRCDNELKVGFIFGNSLRKVK